MEATVCTRSYSDLHPPQYLSPIFLISLIVIEYFYLVYLICIVHKKRWGFNYLSRGSFEHRLFMFIRTSIFIIL